MRTLRLLIVAAAAVLIAGSASAELIFYKGTLKQSAAGLGVNKKLNSRFYLIVDHDTANIAGIQYTTVGGSKVYYTLTETNLHFVQVSGANGKTSEAIARPPNDCDVSAGDTTDTVFVHGADSLLAVNTNSAITFPRILTGADREIDYSGGSPIYIETAITVGFDQTQTPVSNQGGETLDAALARISSDLEGQGYNKQSEKSRNSKRLHELLQSSL